MIDSSQVLNGKCDNAVDAVGIDLNQIAFKKICLNGVAGAGGELHCSKLAGSVRGYVEVGAVRNRAEIGIIVDVESAVLSPVELIFVDAQVKSPSGVVGLNQDCPVVANNKG